MNSLSVCARETARSARHSTSHNTSQVAGYVNLRCRFGAYFQFPSRFSSTSGE